MDDTVGELALATLVVPFAVAFLAGLVLLVTAPKNDQGVWMRPLGSESWVSPNVRLTGILSLYFVMFFSGYDLLDGGEVATTALVSNALAYLGVGSVGIRRNWEYLSSTTRADSRKRLLVELAFFGMHFMFLVLGLSLSTARVSQMVGSECPAHDPEHAPQPPVSWHDSLGSQRRQQMFEACSSQKQWCASPEWYVFCTELLPVDAPGLPCPR